MERRVAAALAGDVSLARQRFASVLDEEPMAPWMDDAQQAARELVAMVRNRNAVRAWALSSVASCRGKGLRLTPAPLDEDSGAVTSAQLGYGANDLAWWIVAE